MKKRLKWLWLAQYSPFDLILFLVVGFSTVLVGAGVTSAYKYKALAQTFLISPLPKITVEPRQTQDDYQRDYQFSEDWFSWNVPIWAALLEDYQGQPDVNYLEVGAFEGRSLLWMLENILTDPTARATVIDVFDGELKERYFKNIKLSGASEKVTTIINYSQIALRDLPLDSFDIIYIDGSHAKEDVLEDAILSWRLLKEGGLLIFDDYRWADLSQESAVSPKPAIDVFFGVMSDRFDVVHNDYQVVLRRSQ
jgi:SAM-dependent methyltransferase